MATHITIADFVGNLNQAVHMKGMVKDALELVLKTKSNITNQ
jgi:hypothetical protein